MIPLHRETFYERLRRQVREFERDFIPYDVRSHDDFAWWKNGCRPHGDGEREHLKRVHRLFIEFHRFEDNASPAQYGASMQALETVRRAAVATFPNGAAAQ
jgi:hypothetical protein